MSIVASLALFAALNPVPAVRAQADLAALFSTAEYPEEALMRGETGTVRFRLSVTQAGLVASCRVTGSSGSQSLDTATCAVLERAQFDPARNAAGEPVPDEITNQITWALPPEPTGARARANLASYIFDGDYPPESVRNREQGEVEFELDISPEGRAVNCRVIRSTTGRLLNLRTCQAMLVRARFRPARDQAGNPVADTISSRIRWILPEE